MFGFFRRFMDDVRRRRYLDAYAVGFVAFAMAVATMVADELGTDFRWAVALAGIGIIVLRFTVSDGRGGVDRGVPVGDRSAFDGRPLADRLRQAREVCVFAPSAANVLNEQNSELFRSEVLGRANGRVRMVVLDPSEEQTVALAVRQLDKSLTYQRSDFRADLRSSVDEFRRMSDWKVAGTFEYGFLPYNPGFSMIALNPGSRDGTVIVELHGFSNETTAKRMHLEFTRDNDRDWYEYWAGQFEQIWSAARAPRERSELEDVR